MRFSDIKIQHIYSLDFNPVRYCEFDRVHLALVLKRNNDKQTFIVMPLTSQSNGVGLNKVKLGTLNSLPSSLRTNVTYAVFNQIRTVNASRFTALKEGSNIVQSKIDDEMFINLLHLGINELTFNLSQDDRLRLYKNIYEQECVTKAKDLAYNILKLKKDADNREHEILSIRQQIKDILFNVPYNLEQKFIDDGIKDIFDEVLANN